MNEDGIKRNVCLILHAKGAFDLGFFKNSSPVVYGKHILKLREDSEGFCDVASDQTEKGKDVAWYHQTLTCLK